MSWQFHYRNLMRISKRSLRMKSNSQRISFSLRKVRYTKLFQIHWKEKHKNLFLLPPAPITTTSNHSLGLQTMCARPEVIHISSFFQPLPFLHLTLCPPRFSQETIHIRIPAAVSGGSTCGRRANTHRIYK